MFMRQFLVIAIGGVLASVCSYGAPIACSAVAGNVVANCSFETNNVGSTSGFLYSNQGLVAAPWTFTARSGVSGINNGSFGMTGADASYNAFLQQFSGDSPQALASIAQNLTLAANTNYTLTALSELRPGFAANPVTVLFNGTAIGTITATSGTTPTNNVLTFSTTTTGATGALMFRSAGTATSGDIDLLLDNVSIAVGAAVPEPVTFAMIGLGLAGISLLRRRAAR
jgi:hypothetical protein